MSRWEPKNGDTYYFFYSNGNVDNTTWINCCTDKILFNRGNVFRNAAEAEIASKKVKELLLSLHCNETSQTNDVTLPDWCKPGAWAWSNDFGFFLITSVKDGAIKGECPGYGEVFMDYHFEKIKEAYLRPFDDEEMKSLVGQILVNKETKDINLVTDYINEVDEDDPSYHYCTVYVGGENMVAEDLLEDFTIDGYPCGQLERKDDHDDNF